MHIEQFLRGGDRRSIGKANQLVARAIADPAILPQIIAAMASEDPLVAMRAADAAEKISRQHSEWFTAHRAALIKLLQIAKQQEVIWHLAQIVPRLPLTEAERKSAFVIFKSHLGSQSRIVMTFALQALFDLRIGDMGLERDAAVLIRKMSEQGPPSVRARARKLLKPVRQQKGRE